MLVEWNKLWVKSAKDKSPVNIKLSQVGFAILVVVS